MSENIFEKAASAPSVALEKTIETTQNIEKNIPGQGSIKKAKDYWHNLGPGLTTGAADDDPSGVTTYSQTGAAYGFNFLWLAGFTFPLMAVVQEMCARIGLVTGRGLAANIREHYPRWVLYLCTFLLFLANSLNIGADLGAMAQVSQLIIPSLNFETMVLAFAVLSLGLQIFTSYESYAKYLKWLALILLSYIFTTLIIPDLNWQAVLQGAFIPSLTWDRDQILLVCAILGTTISPYLFFWQTSQEVEDQIMEGKVTLQERKGTDIKAVKTMRIDVWSGMFLSNLVMFFIITASAATLYSNGITNITSASEAALALKPIAGDKAYILFALGIIGTGMLAVPVLAGSASYAISESMGWKYGLYRKLREANAFYGIIIISTLVGLSINFLGFDPIKVLIYSAVFNGLVAPIVLVLIVLLSSNKAIMGEWSNGWVVKIIGWGTVLVMTLAGIATIYSLLG